MEPEEKRNEDRCECHDKDNSQPTGRIVVLKLIIAAGLGILFMVIEFTGGYLANSLAVMTDAAHMLTDVTSFGIALLAIALGKQKPSKHLNYGWQRTEVLGALLSVVVIYGIVGFLFYESIRRLLNPDTFEVNPDIMLITGCVGVFINVMLCVALRGHGHTHSHGLVAKRTRSKREKDDNRKSGKGERKKTNINLQAATIHVVGDLLQTVGVIVAGYIIWFRRDWKIVDPICTLIFAVIMSITTLGILKEIILILLEAVPPGINFIDVRDDLYQVKGVKHIHSLHIWAIAPGCIALTSHLAIEAGKDHDEVLGEANALLRDDYKISLITIQVEPHNPGMDTCKICVRETSRTRSRGNWWPGRKVCCGTNEELENENRII